MYDNEINKLNDITKQIKRINNKLLLLSLLNKAKKEYDENNYENCEDTCKEVLKTPLVAGPQCPPHSSHS